MASEMNGILAVISGCYGGICEGDARQATRDWLQAAMIVEASGAAYCLRNQGGLPATCLCGLRCLVSDAPAQVESYRRLGPDLASVRMARHDRPGRPACCPLPVGTFVLSRQPAASGQDAGWRIHMFACDA